MILKTPLGRFGISRDAPQGSGMLSGFSFKTNLKAEVWRNGRPVRAKDVISAKDRYFGGINGYHSLIDLGSGLVTNVGVLSMAADFVYANPSATIATTLAAANYHFSGKGATAAAATDISIQTISTNGGQTPVAGAQSLISAANVQKYQTVATIAYTGTEAVTEWGLITNGTVSTSTGTPFTAGSATSGTVTGTPLTASSTTVLGQQLNIMTDTSNATPMWGLVTSNTTSVAQVPAWYKIADGTAAGATPANADTLLWRPIMWDHKVFSAINVLNGDSVQYTYLLTITSGG